MFLHVRLVPFVKEIWVIWGPSRSSIRFVLEGMLMPIFMVMVDTPNWGMVESRLMILSWVKIVKGYTNFEIND